MPTNDVTIEIWKNTTHGMRWCKMHDRAGNENTKLVNSKRTFSITPLDRQLNQDIAATPQLDLFRNGTFELVRKADDTNMDEIQSPDSLTEGEVVALSMEVMGNPEGIDFYLKDVSSPVALNRVLDQLVADGVDKSAVSYVKMKIAKFDPSVRAAVVHEAVTAPEEEPEISTPRGGIPAVETPEYVKTVPEQIGG
jgi:hypothetical protein